MRATQVIRYPVARSSSRPIPHPIPITTVSKASQEARR
jgi:hypothetical protein